MELLTRNALLSLSGKRKEPCVSLFMPSHRAGQEIRQDPIRLKNLLAVAQEELISYGLRAVEARRLISPAESLVNDGAFWRHQSDGLALFISLEEFHVYRLPLAFDELTIVSEAFHLKPLLPLLTGDGRFFLLDLNRSRVRLYEGTRMGLDELTLTGIATSMAEALKYDEQEQQLQFHTRAATAGGTERRAMFFGHGGGKDRAKNDVLRFFQQLDTGLSKLLRDEKAPLLLAGPEELHAVYREASSYRHVLEQAIPSHTGELNEQLLHARAWSLVGPFFERQQREYMARYQELSGTGLASSSIEDILPACAYGRVEALFAARGREAWGRFDHAANSVILHETREAGDEDILNTAAMQAILHDGDVYVVPEQSMPGGEKLLAALFRY